MLNSLNLTCLYQEDFWNLVPIHEGKQFLSQTDKINNHKQKIIKYFILYLTAEHFCTFLYPIQAN